MSSQHAHFGMPTVVISTSLAARLAVVFQIIDSGIHVPSLPHQNKKFKFKYIKGTTGEVQKEREIKLLRKRIQITFLGLEGTQEKSHR